MSSILELRMVAMEPAAKRGRRDSSLKDKKDTRLERKPYFVSLTAKSLDGVVSYDTSTHKLSFKRLRVPVTHPLSAFEVSGLIFCRHQGVFNIHNRTWHVVPPAPEAESKHRPAIGMMVDTSARPYTFKLVMGSLDRKTQVYDSKTRSWSTRSSKVMQVAKAALNSPKAVSCVCTKGCIYISIDTSTLLVYSMEADKWKILVTPQKGLGVWDGRVFTTREDVTLTVWELVDRQWTQYAVMSKQHYHLVSQKNEVRFCDGYLLILSSSAGVVLDLASKKWKQVAMGAEDEKGNEGESGDESEGSEGEEGASADDEGGSACSEGKEGGSDDGDEVDSGEGLEGGGEEDGDDNEEENGESSDDNEEGEEDGEDSSEDEDEE